MRSGADQEGGELRACSCKASGRNCDEFTQAGAVHGSGTCHVEDHLLGAGTNNADIFWPVPRQRFLLALSSRTITECPPFNATIMCVQEEWAGDFCLLTFAGLVGERGRA